MFGRARLKYARIGAGVSFPQMHIQHLVRISPAVSRLDAMKRSVVMGVANLMKTVMPTVLHLTPVTVDAILRSIMASRVSVIRNAATTMIAVMTTLNCVLRAPLFVVTGNVNRQMSRFLPVRWIAVRPSTSVSLDRVTMHLLPATIHRAARSYAVALRHAQTIMPVH